MNQNKEQGFGSCKRRVIFSCSVTSEISVLQLL